jgi:cbb3-type cytochrome oxidase subunit 3
MFGLGAAEIVILLISWLFLVAFMVAVIFLAYRGWNRERVPDATAALVDQVRQLRDEIAELKKGRT